MAADRGRRGLGELRPLQRHARRRRCHAARTRTARCLPTEVQLMSPKQLFERLHSAADVTAHPAQPPAPAVRRRTSTIRAPATGTIRSPLPQLRARLRGHRGPERLARVRRQGPRDARRLVRAHGLRRDARGDGQLGHARLVEHRGGLPALLRPRRRRHRVGLRRGRVRGRRARHATSSRRRGRSSRCASGPAGEGDLVAPAGGHARPGLREPAPAGRELDQGRRRAPPRRRPRRQDLERSHERTARRPRCSRSTTSP